MKKKRRNTSSGIRRWSSRKMRSSELKEEVVHGDIHSGAKEEDKKNKLGEIDGY